MKSSISQATIPFFPPLYYFSWCLQELSAGKSQDYVTSQSTALGSHRSAPPTPTKLMGLPVKEERHIAIMACVSHTKTSACSCGGQVRTRLAVYCIVFGTYNIIQYPAVMHSVYGSSILHLYSQWQNLRRFFSCLTHLEEGTQISHAQTMSDKWQGSGWHRVRWLPGPTGISYVSLSYAGAWPAPDTCFEKVNDAGDVYGNCGKDVYGNYRKCEKR